MSLLNVVFHGFSLLIVVACFSIVLYIIYTWLTSFYKDAYIDKLAVEESEESDILIPASVIEDLIFKSSSDSSKVKVHTDKPLSFEYSGEPVQLNTVTSFEAGYLSD